MKSIWSAVLLKLLKCSKETLTSSVMLQREVKFVDALPTRTP